MAFINLTLAGEEKYEFAVLGGTFRLELGTKRIKMNLIVKQVRRRLRWSSG
jgi:hypothetical protein